MPDGRQGGKKGLTQIPRFRVEGRGKETQKKRAKVYFAKSGEAAKQKAKQDGTLPESVTLIAASHLSREVAGVSHKNANNTSRQKTIRKCRVWDELVLDHEQDNKHDQYAVRVSVRGGSQIGYLPSDLAKMVMSEVSSQYGFRYRAYIAGISESRGNDPILRVDLLLTYATTDASPQAIDVASGEVRRKLTDLPHNIDLQPTRQVGVSTRLRQGGKRQQKADSSKAGCLSCIVLCCVFLVCLASFLGV